MLLLETANRNVSHTLYTMLSGEQGVRLVKVGDFHGTQWEIYADGEGKIYLCVYLSVSRSRLGKWGLHDHLAKVYGKDAFLPDGEELPDVLTEEPDVCIVINDDDDWRDRSQPYTKSDREAIEKYCNKYASLYQQCMYVAFTHHFKIFEEGETFKPVRLAYREMDSMYIHGTKDNVAVYTSMVFETAEDLLYGTLFLQEFADIKKHERGLAGAPSCGFSKEIPSELSATKNVEAEAPNRLWITFTLFGRHCDTSKPDTVMNTVQLLLQFRNYVNYHISCCHAYVHSRMRTQHSSLLKVLNRAKTNQTGHVVVKIQ